MRIISSPASLRTAASLLFLTVPLAGIQVILGSRALWWRLPLMEISIACAGAATITAPIVVSLIRGRAVAFPIATAAATLWCIASFVLATREGSTGLGYFAIFLLGYFYVALQWVRTELSRSYLDPRQAWFQGLPSEIAGLSCKVIQGAESRELRVCRLDTEGAFVFAHEPGVKYEPAPGAAELLFRFRDFEIKCSALARGALTAGSGVGFQFVGLSPDLRKDLGDFVELLRGEGYVV